MLVIYIRLTVIILMMSLLRYSFGDAKNLAYTISENLIQKPYLQQLTNTGVAILWTTNTGSNPMVQYSTDTSYGSVANGASRPLSQLSTQLHRVELTGLQSNTIYHYKIYTEGEDLLPDEVLSFKTAPLPGSITPFTFLAFGDYGKDSKSQKRLRDQMLGDTFSFILTTGDNAYGDGTYSQFDQRVFQIYGDIFKQAAIFPTLGNHDYHTNEGAPYLDLFDLPQNAWRPDDSERYYSFDYGNAHFVGLDSNTPLDAKDEAATDDMFDWLHADLSQTSQPWKIVAFHHPAYSTGKHGSNSRVQAKLVPIFEEYGVDLVLNGHDHIYQRSKPLWGGQETPIAAGGIIYIVTGAGSQASYACSQVNWSVIEYCSKDYGLYSRITLNGNRLIGEAIDEEGMVQDYFVIEDDSLVFTPAENVSISGPTLGAIQTDYTFTAVVSPISATLPITYTWQGTEQAPITHTGGLSDTITLTWPTTGTKAITVTAANITSTVTDTHSLCLAQGNDGYIEEVRQLDTNDAGILNPAGLAYSFEANLFYIITIADANDPTAITMMTPFEESLGSVTVDTSEIKPINMAFDNLRERLLLLDTAADELIAIATKPDGQLDPAPEAVTRFDIEALELQQPEGMTIDRDSGILFILDNGPLEIVRVEPDAQGDFDGQAALDEGRVSRIDLQDSGLAQGRGLALNPDNGHLYVFNKTEEKIHQLSETGQLIATLNMAPFGFVAPQGLVFGFSGDLTDDPAKINLYVADPGLEPEPESNLSVYLPLVIKPDSRNNPVSGNVPGNAQPPLGRMVEFTLMPGCG